MLISNHSFPFCVKSFLRLECAPLSESERNPLIISSLIKAMTLLKAFGEGNAVLGISDLVRITGIEKSSVQRILATLYAEGMLNRDNHSRRYRLSNQWLHMAYAHYIAEPLTSQVMPRLFALQQQIGQSFNLAEICDTSIIYSVRLPVQRTNFEGTLVGRTHPALNTSGGRAILSTWDAAARQDAVKNWPVTEYTPRTTVNRGEISDLVEQARQDGFAVSVEEILLNEIGIAAPIKSSSGKARAAIHCSVSMADWSVDRVRKEIAPLLVDTARTFFDPRAEE
ncbi:IclR family transcriptional regulator C-terminal domain-containing protein [Ochrobactrum sp. SFR4]|uniref:IclR family transcriptional regulator n=1 Tax=Ochrobactrum sp. SFR4 TaxID=2717368 RepID=UPI0025709B4F|nr:IclR family transcriptional regulator C-terminal domain-containing protein [Ochrobactrum sp. SFR4]